MTTNLHDHNLSVGINQSGDFHLHVSGPHFRDYHLLLDEQATQIFATIDPMAERVRKLGSHTLRSIGDIAGLQRIEDSDTAEIAAKGMLSELLKDNRRLVNVRRGG
jgi:starvation-inducible DNA-binding protein